MNHLKTVGNYYQHQLECDCGVGSVLTKLSQELINYKKE